jgi:hypothetical protein
MNHLFYLLQMELYIFNVLNIFFIALIKIESYKALTGKGDEYGFYK